MAIEETTERAIFFDSNEFADSITITIGGSASTIKGIFDNEMTTIDVGDNAGITANQPKITVKTSDVANAFVSLALMERTTGALLTVDGGNVSAMVR